MCKSFNLGFFFRVQKQVIYMLSPSEAFPMHSLETALQCSEQRHRLLLLALGKLRRAGWPGLQNVKFFLNNKKKQKLE